MSVFTRNLKSTITYWGSPSDDGTGYQSFSTPVNIKARWEDTKEIFTNTLGREEISRAIVYCDQVVVEGGFLYNGESTESDPMDVTEAYPIKRVDNSPNLSGTKNLIKAYL
jgi:hypothetical protein